MHIKRHTAGTSNEISFDVLDAARDRLDAQDGRKGKAKKGFALGKRGRTGAGTANALGGEGIPVSSSSEQKGLHVASTKLEGKRGRSNGFGSSKGSSAASGNPLMPADEVLRRRRARRAGTARKYAIGIGAIVVAVAVVGVFTYSAYQDQQAFDQRFRDAAAAVSKSDVYLVEIDEAMNDPLGSTTDEERDLLRKKAVAVMSSAEGTTKTADALAGQARTDTDKVALEQLSEGASCRKNMVGLAMEAFGIADQAASAKMSAEAQWKLVVDADVAAREALSQANSAITTSELEKTTSVLEQSRDEFSVALLQLQALEATHDGLDLTAQEKYLEKRVETLGYAIATNKALASGDRQTAAEQNELYEAGDRESADLAKRLPQTIGASIDAAFTEDILNVQARYDKERERVAAADSRVRAYLK